MANSLQGKWQSGSQWGRQASGGKWQESGMDAPSGNVTATSRQRDRRAATMQRWLHRTHCTKKWPTMRAVQKAQWWLNTRLAAVVTPLCLPLLYSSFSVGCSSYLLPVAAALFACSGQMPAAMAALPPLGHWCQVTDGKNCQPSGCACECVYICICVCVCIKFSDRNKACFQANCALFTF